MSDPALPVRTSWLRRLMHALGSVALVFVGLLLTSWLLVPTYRDYTEKSQFSEAPSIVDGMRTRVHDYYRAHGRLPRSNTEVGLPAPASINGKYVASVKLRDDGEIVALFSARSAPALAGRTVHFWPVIEQGEFHWRCRSPRISDRYLPQACQSR